MSQQTRQMIDEPEQQSIEQLQERYEGLHTKKIQVETQRDAAKTTLDDLKKKARENYGTDDIGELQKKLQEMKEENERKRAAYQAQLDKIERDLAEVEREFAATEKAPATPAETMQ